MPRAKAKLTDSSFSRDDNLPFPQPEAIKAHENGIVILFRRKNEYEDEEVEKATVFLSPRHIEAIVAMAEDWGESHWDALHEEQA